MAPSARVETGDVIVTIPAGYTEITASMKQHLPGIEVALEGPRDEAGTAVIVFQRSSTRGGQISAAGCAELGRAMVEDGPQLPGKPAKLRAATLVAWTGGRGCAYDYVTPDGVPTRMTEFHDAARTPREIWTMTCQHDDDDQAAKTACRDAGATFVVKPRP